jgi:ribosome biogenesis GTPase
MAKKKKRVELRKNRTKPPRANQWTRGFQEHGFAEEATVGDERVRAKGAMSRKRTIMQEVTAGQEESAGMPSVDPVLCLPGRVLRVHGLSSVVQTDAGREYRCAVRRLLKSLATDERSIVTTGDRVWIRPFVTVEDEKRAAEDSQNRPEEAPAAETGGAHSGGGVGSSSGSPLEGFIERVEPRHGMLTRSSRHREHVIVANVDQFVIVMAVVEPDLKPHLIDRYLASAEQGGIAPILCLNKADLIDPVEYQPLIGQYSQLGVPTLLTSATTGKGIDHLRRLLKDRQTVFAGQSGVGKSSLLNALQPGLGLRVREVSTVNQKGRHTTTTAELLQLEFGGWVVDTPGIRQFELWDIIPEEVEGFFPEFRPYVPLCAFPDCSHTHENRCAIKQAVRDRYIRENRYMSYIGMFTGKTEELREE